MTRILVVVAMIGLSALVVLAQTTPLGHWEGTIRAPGMDVKIEIDLTRNEKGALAGTFSQPAQGVKGLPISTISIDGLTLRFIVKGGAEPSTFEAAVAADGQSMGGEVFLGSMSASFTLTRTGDARLAPAASRWMYRRSRRRSSASSTRRPPSWSEPGARDPHPCR